MLNFAILTITVIVLLVSLKRLGRILSAGSIDNVIKRSEDQLVKLKKDLNTHNSKALFGFAWLFCVIITTSLIGLSTYILVNILNFA
jgi:hypothetical protein